MMTEKTSWRNLKGGLPSNFSVRGGFFTNGPRLSWVALITAASTAMFQVLQSRRCCQHLRNTRNVWGTEVLWLSPWYTSKNTYILFHTSYISFHLDLSRNAYPQVHFSYSALFFSPVPSMRQIVTDRPSTLWYILLSRSRRSLQNWPQKEEVSVHLVTLFVPRQVAEPSWRGRFSGIWHWKAALVVVTWSRDRWQDWQGASKVELPRCHGDHFPSSGEHQCWPNHLDVWLLLCKWGGEGSRIWELAKNFDLVLRSEKS